MQDRRRCSSLAWLIWWSIRLAWTSNKMHRRHLKENIWLTLSYRWRMFIPDSPPGTETGIVRAVWLGAALASRSQVRYPLLAPKVQARLLLVRKILGHHNGKAVVTAYLAWIWLRDVALSAPELSPTFGHTGG